MNGYQKSAFIICTSVLTLVCTVATANETSPSNLIYNGDFQLGNTGFSTDYNPTLGIGATEGTYGVVSNPYGPPPGLNPWGVSYYDHTLGNPNGLMLAVNGSPQPGMLVWGQIVTHLTVGQQYNFSLWLSTWSQLYGNPADISVQMNGVTQASFSAPATAGVWEEQSMAWTATSSTVVLAAIFDDNTGILGNDFALDDISMVPVSAEPEGPPVPDSPLGIFGSFPAFVVVFDYIRRRFSSLGRSGWLLSLRMR